MKQDRRLTIDAELRAQTPQPETPEDGPAENSADPQPKGSQTNKGKTISGYAIVWNSPSKDLGGFTEIVTPKALDGVDLSNVLMLNNHDYTQVLASVKAGTLTLETDDKGLHFIAQLPNTSFANDVYEEVQSGNVDSCSFGFDSDDDTDEWTKDDDGNITRTINQVKSLFDVSVVAVPAYDDTNVQVDTRSYEKFINQEKEPDNMAKQTIIDPNTNEDDNKTGVPAFEAYVRSHGETRDGLNTSGASAVIPKELITPVFQLKQSTYNLAQYATVKQVSSGSGTYPISTSRQSAVLATKEELADIADVNANMFTEVPFDVKTRAGKIALSNEVVEDAEVDIVSEVKTQLQQLVDNTDNTQIMGLLTGTSFAKATATNIDDLKKIFNVALDPALSKMWLVNQSGFNYLDTLKDSEGRYLLQPNPTAPSGFTLLGAPVVMISDKLLANNADGTFPMIVGDLSQAVAVFRRNQVTAQWDKFDQFSQGLSVIVRNDYEVIDKSAAINVALGTATSGK
ncbi:phage major capsid protein [Secundilactobacillus paracollinoides]|uniref:Capsid protein n=1 Tax=Secundilactobacillus paracollinoides TaxID=240427 RepID=A0A1B2IWV2_9LACO|nr:phage major capsid protein [Secundilactobacillus paracollinoides]ANZ60659.1 capsid protein [Secundilactobacillus paracollinoides]ANZ66502.1 capsid protein [Secundilactobacillus paracollinoides]KRL78794.1 prophage p2b protein 18, major capsid protein [Secundilactobacillus paracollinoides DSM 15502 = JCM 11969]